MAKQLVIARGRFSHMGISNEDERFVYLKDEEDPISLGKEEFTVAVDRGLIVLIEKSKVDIEDVKEKYEQLKEENADYRDRISRYDYEISAKNSRIKVLEDEVKALKSRNFFQRILNR